ncbi:MAG: DUF711 family protein [Brevefilum fermentans]|jgi:uncharacterized protein (UPF0210 family)|uniref:DUF711 domain-containing protein n=1 Tax=Candidatus Brevifilum fermentans TaxID=1986204 RepID=A0A1Y6K7S3_9CHLR|nr:DUF711 family protein [Brevefilum fermentans]MDI9566545.1 DUF711 family protein [Chloroflexota bacterium]SMX54938.1 conserved protein of unknown function [Brevefilum fermentans]HOM67289.1 DUF711 family protein [Brevefilum fermentans]
MRIRSITCFVHPRWPVSELVFQKAGLFARMARQSFENAGYAVQTVRMATPPFAEFITEQDYAQAGTHIDVIAHSEGFEYVSLGPALTGVPQSYAAIPELLSRSGNLFFGGHLTTPNAEVSLSAVRACAQVIHQAATLEANGFANLRFAALANVPPWAPFFPAAYHQGKSPAFALALEAADLAVSAFTEAQSLQDARQKLVDRIEAHARDLQTIAQRLADAYGVEFKGLDFTLAPFPQPDKSIGVALELLGLPALGLAGSLAASAFLTETLDQAVFKRSGFNGLMLPLLEDATLAARGAQGVLGVNDLLLYSAVCGTGLDTIPLPGETSVEQLSALLLDLAALALRLDKPLTARLMPIPGKAAGDDTNFNFEYFANSKVLALPAEPLTGLLSGDENIAIQHRVD